MLKPLTVIALTIVIVLFASQTILAQLSSLRLIGSRGMVNINVVGVGVYGDANCTNPIYSVNWGSISPGSVKNVTVFIRNEGNQPSTLLLNATNWSPANASSFITLSWDYGGQTVAPQQAVKATLMLSISPFIKGIKDFTFDIIIGING